VWWWKPEPEVVFMKNYGPPDDFAEIGWCHLRPHLFPGSVRACAKRVVGFGNKHVEGFCDHDYDKTMQKLDLI
jgi:hypothetical protein